MKLKLGSKPSGESNILKRTRQQSFPTVPASVMLEKILGVTLFLLLVSPSRAEVGKTICACSPQTYEFTLDFSLTCENTQLDGVGIEEFECVIAPFQTGVEIDLVPASVETIDFVEFDQALGRIAESSLFGTYLDGAKISYASVSAKPEDITIPSVPKSLQITMLAQNSIGQPLLMTWLATFSNSCGEYPVVSTGNQIGWTRISDVTEADSSLCPAVDGLPPTKAPSPTPPPHPSGTSYPTYWVDYPTYAPIGPCRPAGSSSKKMMSGTAPSGKGKAKGKGKGGPSNIFSDGYNPYYNYKGKGGGMSSSKSSSSSSMGKKKGGKMSHSKSYKDKYKGNHYHYHYHHYQMSSKSRRLKMMKSKSHKHYYPSSTFWYSKGKGKGDDWYDRHTDVQPEDDDEEEEDDDLPICPPPRPHPPRPHPKRPSAADARPPAWSPTTDQDGRDNHPGSSPNMAPTRAPNSTPTTATSPVQESQENDGDDEDGAGRQADPDEPVVASWGDDDDSKGGLSNQGVRAALFAGAGVAAGLVAVIATYIYRREKKFVSKELSLQQQSRGRLGAMPRQDLPLTKTFSATVSSTRQ